MRYAMQPLGTWTDPVTDNRWPSHRFKASWTDTLDFLAYECEYLGAGLVVVQVDVRDYDVRADGMLRANAKVGGFPGVRVSFESIHGPLTYATDAYEQQVHWSLPSWQANVRAIALALEALRAVDRYGVSRRGQQYTGWTAIEATAAKMTREQAAEFIAHWSGDWSGHDTAAQARMILADPGAVLSHAYRLAAKRAHPDVTRDDGDTMARLNVARDLLAGGRNG